MSSAAAAVVAFCAAATWNNALASPPSMLLGGRGGGGGGTVAPTVPKTVGWFLGPVHDLNAKGQSSFLASTTIADRIMPCCNSLRSDLFYLTDLH